MIQNYKKQLKIWNKYIRSVQSKVKSVFPNGFIDQEFDTDKIIGEVLVPLDYHNKSQEFVYKASGSTMDFKKFKKTLSDMKVRNYDPKTGKLLSSDKMNVWTNIDDAKTKQRLVKQIQKEAMILQKRVDFLRNSRERLKNGDPISVKYIEELAKKTEDKEIKAKARRFVREYNGYTPKRLESTYTALTDAIEKDIIDIQQKRMINDVVERTVASPVKRTAQTTMVQLEAEKAMKELKGDKYVRIVLNPNRTYKLRDVCDVITGANPTGLGKGVYPKESAPLPSFHVNCGCRIVKYVSSK